MAVADIVHADERKKKAKGDSEWLSDRDLFTACQIFIALFYPPLAVFLERGCGKDLCINVLLTILMYIPGCLHALDIIETDTDLSSLFSDSDDEMGSSRRPSSKSTSNNRAKDEADGPSGDYF
ncbi:hypothetical protein MNV49_005688 [Pseudohyphozyma bogoriensis]|nr:hypothetical protein MNV49_005688 [Pseudohyphozyma bogoriensis]